MSGTRVLCVDDDETYLRVLSRELERSGYEICACSSAEEAIRSVKSFRPRAALVDLRLPEMSGIDLLRRFREEGEEVEVIMVTGHGSVPEAVEAMQLGAYDFLTKPAPLAVIEQALARACEKHDLIQENRRLRRAASGRDEACDLIGESALMKRLYEDVLKIAVTDTNVLIQGENGTGKELVARCLHQSSNRSEQPFVVVNCGAIPEGLVESELFGHVKGSFTGAEGAKVGLFEAADGGTLFLDEVGELPPSFQPALLRVLQFGEVRPVGSQDVRTVDVRVLSATNRDLHDAMEDGSFRQDLYYRLATMEILVPTLRERAEDIGPLARFFLDKAARRSDREMVLTPSAIENLEQHPWPGNVRQLENVMIQLSVLCDDDRVGAEAVRSCLGGRMPGGDQGDGLPTLRLEELEKLAVQESLARFDGNKKRAAEALGIALKTLYNKLDRYGLR